MTDNYAPDPDLGEYAEFVDKPLADFKAYLMGQENKKVGDIFMKYVQGMSG